MFVAPGPIADTEMFESVMSPKKTAYFLAMSRGRLFDDMALVRALTTDGLIADAGAATARNLATERPL